jgi:anti-sigma B factor antagonist
MTAALSIPVPLALPPHHWWALHVSGDLDLVTGPSLDARLGRAVTLHHDDGLVLSLTGVPFMDCAGLGPLLRARNRLGRRFCLRGLQPRVLRLLEVAGVAASLRILPATDLWPTEADPQRCHVVLDDLLDHRPARPVVRLGNAPVQGSL